MKTRMHPEFGKWSKRVLTAGLFSITLPVPALYLTDLIADITTTQKIESREDYLRVKADLRKIIDEERARLHMKEKVRFRLSSKIGAGWEEYCDGSRIIRIGYNCANPTKIRHEIWHEFRGHNEEYEYRRILGFPNHSGLGKFLDEFDKWCVDESSAIFYSVAGYRFYPKLY
ncbi:hypothetical protein HYT51_01070 [Candidatus Woesearchaeota archaeon]|nr:hypothetical protein [Candidatus Woesearchaeota archaeon]